MTQRAFDVVVYGATGFTGRLVCRELDRQGTRFAVGGRDRAKLEQLAASLASTPPVFAAGIDDAAGLRAFAEPGRVLLSCAGPFEQMGPPVLDAALAAGTHWLDITGEHTFMDQTWARDAEARERGVALVNAVGMDVIPTDVVAALASEGLEDVDWLRIAIAPKGGFSRGTLRSAVGVVGSGGMAILDGKRVYEPALGDVWEAPFPPPLGPRHCLSLPLADIVTAPRTTGCRNLRIYGRGPELPPGVAPLAGRALKLLGSGPGRLLARAAVRLAPEGPSAEVQEAGGFMVVAEAVSSAGRRRRAWMKGPEAYGFTAIASVLCARMAASDGFDKRGTFSPVQAFGAHALVEALRPRGVEVGVD